MPSRYCTVEAKLTADRYEGSRGLSATAELLVGIPAVADRFFRLRYLSHVHTDRRRQRRRVLSSPTREIRTVSFSRFRSVSHIG